MEHLSVGQLLRMKRQKTSMSARELSIKIGKSPSYMSKVEAGTIDPGLRVFAKLVSELKLNTYEIAVCLGVEGIE
jgi:predicted transcriptional regulator